MLPSHCAAPVEWSLPGSWGEARTFVATRRAGLFPLAEVCAAAVFAQVRPVSGERAGSATPDGVDRRDRNASSGAEDAASRRRKEAGITGRFGLGTDHGLGSW
ncbi:hypothetical protein HOK021_60760 [Streptomyces hygroscopicus]|nr:hypothetical protein HOK021_60760 [Streptomyces hygroscopicus]